MLRRSHGHDEMDRYFQRSDTITMSAGDAKEVNAVTHTINPWPRYVGDRRIAYDARRVGVAVTRYGDTTRPVDQLPDIGEATEAMGQRPPTPRISTYRDWGRIAAEYRCRSAEQGARGENGRAASRQRSYRPVSSGRNCMFGKLFSDDFGYAAVSPLGRGRDKVMRRLILMLTCCCLGIGLAGCEPTAEGRRDRGPRGSGRAQTPCRSRPTSNIILPTSPCGLGLEHFNRGNYGIAQRYFKDAVEKSPKDVTAWIGLAASYDRLRRFDLADQAYAPAIRLGGETVQILNDQGYSLMLRGNLRRRGENLRRPIRSIPATRSSPIISSCSTAAAASSKGRRTTSLDTVRR